MKTIGSILMLALIISFQARAQDKMTSNDKVMRVVNDTSAMHAMMHRIAEDDMLRRQMSQVMVNSMRSDTSKMKEMCMTMMKNENMRAMMKQMMNSKNMQDMHRGTDRDRNKEMRRDRTPKQRTDDKKMKDTTGHSGHH